jgi:hypothetical protein
MPSPETPMQPEELRRILALLGWGERTLAETLGIHPRTPHRWLQGLPPWMPDRVARWLRELHRETARLSSTGRVPLDDARLFALERTPLPRGWERQDDGQRTQTA